jgi:hypothetical protein
LFPDGKGKKRATKEKRKNSETAFWIYSLNEEEWDDKTWFEYLTEKDEQNRASFEEERKDSKKI